MSVRTQSNQEPPESAENLLPTKRQIEREARSVGKLGPFGRRVGHRGKFSVLHRKKGNP